MTIDECSKAAGIIARLLIWEKDMGGWEAPVWDEARDFIERYREAGNRMMADACEGRAAALAQFDGYIGGDL